MRLIQPRTLGPKSALPAAPYEKSDLMFLEIDGVLYDYQGIIDAYSRFIII